MASNNSLPEHQQQRAYVCAYPPVTLALSSTSKDQSSTSARFGNLCLKPFIKSLSVARVIPSADTVPLTAVCWLVLPSSYSETDTKQSIDAFANLWSLQYHP